MKNRKIHNLLQLIPKKERKRLKAWLEWELFGKKKEILTLYKAFTSSQRVDNETIWASIYRGIPYNDPKFRNLLNRLCGYIENYLVQNSLKRKELEKEKLLLEELAFRKSDELFSKKYRNVKKRLTKREERDSQYYLVQYQLTLLYQENLIKKGFDDHKNYKILLDNFLTQFYGIEIVHIAAYIRSAQRIFNVPYDLEKVEKDVLNFKENRSIEEGSTLDLYYTLYEWDKTPDPNNFQEIIALLKSYKPKLVYKRYQNFFSLVLNAAIYGFNSTGNRAYIDIILEVYHWGISDDLILIDGYLPPEHYINIVSFYLRKKEAPNPFEILTQYGSYLNPKYAEDTVTGGEVIYHFHRREYQEVKRKLSFLNFSNQSIRFKMRWLGVVARYESGERSDLETPITSFRRFVNNNKILTSQQQNVWNIRLKLVLGLVRAQDERDLLALKQTHDATSHIYADSWLLAKIKERLDSIQG